MFADALVPSIVGKNVLDVGCGGGALSAFLAGHGANVVGLDFSSVMIDAAKTNFGQTNSLKFIQADILSADLDEQFDIICGRLVLHEISREDTQELLAFFDRHLKADGFGYFQENSFFNPFARLMRKRLVGRYGIPKYGSEQEMPFDKARFLMYKHHFKYCERSGEVFSLFEKIHAYLIRSGNRNLSNKFINLDQRFSRLGIPDVVTRNFSYLQHIYFSNAYPKSQVVRG
jgi:ubiquinone/menaquinone biosynthesis C-methylase UbiE